MKRSEDTEIDRLQRRIEAAERRIERARGERRTLLAQTLYLGTLGTVFVLPVVAGAYLGNWLDSRSAGYSIRWTVSLIVLGIVFGAYNAYLLIRK